MPSHVKKLEKVYQARNQYQADETKSPTQRKSDTDEPGPVM